MTVISRVVLATLLLPALLAAQGAGAPSAAANAPRVGPASGTVIVVGGGRMGPEIYARFIQAAGGPDALILDVPNAGGAASYDDNAAGARAFRDAGARNVHVLFTTDRAVANSDSIVALIDRASGIWFDGGRQFRLVDDYAGTRTEKAFNDLLARGGVIGGSSAGATILGDFLVRGAPSGDNSIMDHPGYRKGFAYLHGVAIDQHVVARDRLPDLADSIMTRYPDLLGISVDEGTAWVVQGDTAVIIGRNKAFVYGGRDANDPGVPFLTLHPGDRYDLAERRVTHRAIDDSPLTMEFVDGLFADYTNPSSGGATVLVAEGGSVLVDRSYGVPQQPRYAPTTTSPQWALGELSGVFASLCAQLPETPVGSAGGARPGQQGSAPTTAFQRCVARQLSPPIGMHRTTADARGQVSSNVDELYRLALGLQNPRTWPGVDVTQGWTTEKHGDVSWLTAYGTADGRRAAFVRIPDRQAVVIVLTNDDLADARGIAERIADRLVAGRS